MEMVRDPEYLLFKSKLNPFPSSSGDPCVKCERNADQLALQHHPIETGRQSQSGPLVQGQAGEATIQVSDIFLTIPRDFI